MIRASTGGTLRLGAAQIDVPAHALSADARVAIHYPSAIPANEAGPRTAFEFTADGARLTGWVRLHLPVQPTDRVPATAGRRSALAFLDGGGVWRAVPGTAEADGRVTATVTHLSIWGAIGDLTAPFLQFMHDVVTGWLGFRAHSPSCPHPVDQATVEVDYRSGSLPDPPLRWCLANDSAGLLRLIVVNDRSFALRLEATNLDQQPIAFSDSGTIEHMTATLIAVTGRLDIPPGGEVSFLYNPTGGEARLSHLPDPGATLAAIVLGLVVLTTNERYGAMHAVAINDCVRNLIGNGARLDGYRIGSAVGTCYGKSVAANALLKLAPWLAVPASVFAGLLVAVPTALRVLDGWADLTLFDAAVDTLTLRPHSSARPAPSTVPPNPPSSRPTAPSSAQTSPQPPPQTAPPPSQPIVDYDCPNDNSNIGKYIAPGTYWQSGFTAKGSLITGGWVLIGANSDGGDHRARIGVYTGSGLAGPLAEVVVPVTGYDGESFSFPNAVRVTPGTPLYLAVSGVGDFTAYDNRSGCFIGRVQG